MAHLFRQTKLMIICVFIFYILLSGIADAAVITAPSCSAADVQAAMNSANAGDTVVIPAGTCHWSTQVSWAAPANVTLKGAGTSVTGGGDQTVIIDNYDINRPLLIINVSSTGVFHMTGITIKGGSSGSKKDNGVLVFNGPGTIRIDHCHFDTRTYATDYIQKGQKIPVIGNGVYGVMDHCILDLVGESAPYIFNGAGTDGKGNNAWAQPTDFGGGDFFFIEDNIFNGYPSTSTGYTTRLLDGWSAARVVVRFNDLNDCSGPEEHGTGHAGDDRGFRAIEFYCNKSTESSDALKAPNGPNYKLISIQAGTALVWGNEALNCYKNGIIFNVTRKNDNTYNQSAPPNGWGYCGTDFNGTGSPWDGNTDTGTGYPCIDQPGRGHGDLLTGIFSNGSKVNSKTGDITWPHQVLEPIYIWNNDVTIVSGWGGSWYRDNTSTTSGTRVAANRDYYPQASGVQTSPTSPFDGTSGTGWGTLANRPTTCTQGVGYWATDQGGDWNKKNSSSNDGALYKCTATNTWTLYYVPYEYPHPLRGWYKGFKGMAISGGISTQ